MLPRIHEPIVAIATAAGRAAVGIVRASGADLQVLINSICGRALMPRHASYLPFLDSGGQPIDYGLAIYFPAPHSYTGEDVLELQAHGGPVVLQLLIARCLEVGQEIGLRLAEPGEFTARAFFNNKLDLSQAEAVSDLIDAGTEAAARSASRSLSGAFSSEIQELRDRLVTLRMLVEAVLDFPEEDIDTLRRADLDQRLREIANTLNSVLARAQQGALLREGVHVVLAGQPNVGKSSLLNALAGAELAIVTPIPGTTRDKVSETIQICGVPLHVIDTAGLREARDEVERIGVARSWAEIERADAVLFLHDLTRLGQAEYDFGDEVIAQRLGLKRQDRIVHVFNKCDVVPMEVPTDKERHIVLSARTNVGLDELRQTLLALAGWHAQPEGLFIARARHVQALMKSSTYLVRAQSMASNSLLELLAEELRLAHTELSKITGDFTPDDLLGEIFSRFCIGK